MRPRRIYKNKNGRYYYLIKGKKKFIKAPKNLSEKQIININIKNLKIPDSTKKIKKRKKRRNLKYSKKIDDAQKEYKRAESGTIVSKQLPVYVFEPQKNIETILSQMTKKTEQKAKDKEKDDEIKKLKEDVLLLKNEPHNIKTVIETELPKRKKRTLKTDDDDDEKEDIANVEEVTTTNPIATDDIMNSIIEFSKNPKNISGEFEKNIWTRYLAFLKSDKELREKVLANTTTTKNNFKSYLATYDPRKSEEEKIKQIDDKIPDAIAEFVRSDIADKFTRKEFYKFLEESPEYNVFIKSAPKGGVVIRRINKIFDESIKDYLSYGKGHADAKALWNTEIEQILKKRIKPDVIPVIAKNELDTLEDYVYEGMPDFSFIVNTANIGDSEDKMHHWRACYIDNNDDYKTIEYYDSLALGRPEKALIDCLRKLAKIINPEFTFLYKQNNIINQSSTTSTCGYFCIRFLELRNNHVPFSEATGYDSYIENYKKPIDDSIRGEGEIEPIVKKYNSYI